MTTVIRCVGIAFLTTLLGCVQIPYWVQNYPPVKSNRIVVVADLASVCLDRGYDLELGCFNKFDGTIYLSITIPKSAMSCAITHMQYHAQGWTHVNESVYRFVNCGDGSIWIPPQ